MLNRGNVNVKTLMADAGNSTFIGVTGNTETLSDMILITDKPDISENTASPFGNLNIFNKIWNSGVDLLKDDVRRRAQQLILLIRLLEASYEQYDIEPVLFTYSTAGMNEPPQVLENKQRILNVLSEHSRKLYGYQQEPEYLIEMYMADKDSKKLIGAYEAESGMPVPTADAEDLIEGMTVDQYLVYNHEIQERLRVYLTLLRDNKREMAGANYRYRNVAARLNDLLNTVGGPAGSEMIERCIGEPMQPLSPEVMRYIRHCTPGMDAQLAFGCLGKVRNTPLLDNISVMYFEKGTEPVAGTEIFIGESDRAGYREESDEHVGILLAPIQPVAGDVRVEYKQGKTWIRVTASVNTGNRTEVYQRIYVSSKKKYNVVRPNHLVEMYPGVPDDLLAKKLYYEVPNTSGNVGGVNSEWSMLDNRFGNKSEIMSVQDQEKCTVYEMKSRLDRITLKEKIEGELLGTVFVPETDNGTPAGASVTVAHDNGASTNVRVQDTGGRRGPLAFSDMIRPVTPCGKDEIESMKRNFLDPITSGEKSYESMVQGHRILNGNPMLPGTKDRIFSMKGEQYYRLFAKETLSIPGFLDKFGVMAYPKTVLMRSNLKTNVSAKYKEAFKNQVALGILNTVMALAAKGYAPKYNNLQIALAYPNSGLENIGMNAVKEVYVQAIDLVNTFLSTGNQLILNKSVFLYSEGAAAAAWLSQNRNGLAGIPLVVDIGHSTTDIGLYVGNSLFTASVPVGGDEITLQSIADTYGNKQKVNGLLNCFRDMDSSATITIEEALNTAVSNRKQGVRLRDTAGFPIIMIHLFDTYEFSNTSPNADNNQIALQNGTGLRLHMILPAIARVIKMAFEKQLISSNQRIEIVLVGNGAKSFKNTGSAYEATFIEEICSLLKSEGIPHTVSISVKAPSDNSKVAVAEGMLDLHMALTNGNAMNVISMHDPLHDYISLIHNGDGAKIEELEKSLEEMRADVTRLDEYAQTKKNLFHDAFEKIVEQYTLDKFYKDFNTFGHSERVFATEDGKLYRFIKDNFSDLLREVAGDYETYVMSLPGMENEQITAAMISLGYERLAQTKIQPQM